MKYKKEDSFLLYDSEASKMDAKVLNKSAPSYFNLSIVLGKPKNWQFRRKAKQIEIWKMIAPEYEDTILKFCYRNKTKKLTCNNPP